MLVGPIEAVRLFTRNTEKSCAFYRETLELTASLIGDDLAIFETGQAKLVIEHCPPDDAETDTLVGRFAGLSFTVTEMAASVRTLEARGVIFEGPPERQAWGGVLAHFQDPDGNILTLVEYPS